MIGQGVTRRPWHGHCAWLLSVALLLSSCSSGLAPVIPSVSPPSEDEESKISREFRREAKKFLKFLNNPEVERYIDRIGRRILAATGPLSFDYRFFVIEDDQLNAFSVPGGSIYVYTGLIERAKSTDELAGVLGHEITHAKGHHMARSSGPDAISILSLLAMVAAGEKWQRWASSRHSRASRLGDAPVGLQSPTRNGSRYPGDTIHGGGRLRSERDDRVS